MDIKERVRQDRNLVQGDDGIWVWWPTKNEGAYSDYHLKVIIDELRARNQPIIDEMNEYFKDEH